MSVSRYSLTFGVDTRVWERDKFRNSDREKQNEREEGWIVCMCMR